MSVTLSIWEKRGYLQKSCSHLCLVLSSSVHVLIYQVRIIILMENYAGTRPGDRVREWSTFNDAGFNNVMFSIAIFISSWNSSVNCDTWSFLKKWCGFIPKFQIYKMRTKLQTSPGDICLNITGLLLHHH